MKRTAVACATAAVLAACGRGPQPAPVATADAAAATTDGRERRVLLVAVGRYAACRATAVGVGQTPRELEGPRADVAMIRDLLEHRFGVPAPSIRELVDEQATLANVVTTFRAHLIDGVTADTEVIFWFCGHGSRVRDESGRDVLGMDSTLVLHDSRRDGEAAPRDLDDDALFALLSACPSRHLTVVTDSCHSGAVTRGLPDDVVAVREAPFAAAIDHATWDFWPKDLPIRDDDDPRRPTVIPWLHIAACAPAQQAYELRVRTANGRVEVHGALSWALCEQLQTALPGTPWDAIVESVRFRLREDLGQMAQVDGERHATLFGDPLAATPGLAAHAIDQRRILVDGGALQGLAEASRLTLLRLRDRCRIGVARIERLDGVAAIACWQDGPSTPVATTDALLALPISPGCAARALRVARASLQSVPAEVREAALASPWLLAVADGGQPMWQFTNGTEGPALHASDGHRVWPARGEPARPERLADQSAREARFWWLWRLADRPRGQLASPLQLSPATASDCDRVAQRRGLMADTVVPAVVQRDPSLPFWLVGRDPQRPPTAQLLLRFAVGHAARAGHIVVLDLERTHRAIRPLWPMDACAATPERRSEHLVLLERRHDRAGPLETTGLHRLLAISSDRQLDVAVLLDDGERHRALDSDALDQLEPASWGVSGIEFLIGN